MTVDLEVTTTCCAVTRAPSLVGVAIRTVEEERTVVRGTVMLEVAFVAVSDPAPMTKPGVTAAKLLAAFWSVRGTDQRSNEENVEEENRFPFSDERCETHTKERSRYLRSLASSNHRLG